MNPTCSLFSRLLCLTGLATFCHLAQPSVVAAAPESIVGSVFSVQITGGTEPFRSDGFYLFIPLTSSTYATSLDGEIAGTYSYERTSSATAIIFFNSLAGISGLTQQLTFQTATSGTGILRETGGDGYQTGNFTMISASAGPPLITARPRTQTVEAGGTIVLEVTASGVTPMVYQWKKDGKAIPGASTASLSIANAQPSDSGLYSVLVGNAAGSTESGEAVVTVTPTPAVPWITAQPQSQIAAPGQSVSFSVTASVTSTITYQWRKAGQPINGATNSTMVLHEVQAGDAGSYDVVLTAGGASVTSTIATLTVHSPTAPSTIISSPQDQSVAEGASFTLSVVAAGTEPLAYQWLKNGTNVPGATGSDFTISSTGPTDAGTYSVRVSNAAGSVTSPGATVSISPPGQVSTELWRFRTGGSVSSSAAIATDGTIYFGSSDHKFYALSPNGQKRWEFDAGDAVVSAPGIGSDGNVYIGAVDGKLHAISPSGVHLWTFATGGALSSLAIDASGTIYVGSLDGNLYAVSETGAKLWSFPTGGRVFSSPSIRPDGTIVIGSDDGKVYCVTRSGTEAWSFTTGGAVFSSAAVDSKGNVYIGSNDRMLYALDSNGRERWELQTGDGVRSPVLGADGIIYVGSADGKVYAVKENGSKVWEFPTRSWVGLGLSLATDGTVYVGSADYGAYAIKPDGTLKWRFATGSYIDATPVIAPDGSILIGSYDGNLYAIKESSPPALSAWPSFRRDSRNSSSLSATLSVAYGRATGEARIRVAGALDWQRCIETSSDLATWNRLTDLMPIAAGMTNIVDPGAATLRQRFYRILP